MSRPGGSVGRSVGRQAGRQRDALPSAAGITGDDTLPPTPPPPLSRGPAGSEGGARARPSAPALPGLGALPPGMRAARPGSRVAPALTGPSSPTTWCLEGRRALAGPGGLQQHKLQEVMASHQRRGVNNPACVPQAISAFPEREQL